MRTIEERLQEILEAFREFPGPCVIEMLVGRLLADFEAEGIAQRVIKERK